MSAKVPTAKLRKGSPIYKRIVLKIGGEAIQGQLGYGIDAKAALSIASQIKEIKDLGLQVAIVIGGGNIFRGAQAQAEGMDRATADYMGMLATVINGLALRTLWRNQASTQESRPQLKCISSASLIYAAGR